MDVEAWSRAWLVEVIAALGVDKDEVRGIFVEWGLLPLWDLLRHIYFNPYLVLAVVPGLLVLERLKPVTKPAPRRHWLLDFLYPLLSLPVQVSIVTGSIELLRRWIEVLPLPGNGVLDGLPLLPQIAATYLATDFLFYVTHRLHHKVPWLWYLHEVHHSQRYLSPFSLYRVHPLQVLTFFVIQSLPAAYLGGTYPSWFLFSVVHAGWGLFIHANVRTSLGPLRYVFVTPQAHRVHHSIEARHQNKNFGEHLILWDMMFGTWERDTEVYPPTGVTGFEPDEGDCSNIFVAWLGQVLRPLRKILFDLGGLGRAGRN